VTAAAAGARGTREGAGRTALLLGALAAALGVRVAAGAGTARAGLLFAAVVGAAAVAAGQRPSLPRPAALVTGVAGAAGLCAVPAALRLGGHGVILGPPPLGLLPGWAALVVLVAAAEEALLRGALVDAVVPWGGEVLAVGVAAVAFALLHVPLYGWPAVPLDLAAGVWLGGLRLLTGGVAAPATAHALADLAAWWLR
jgi:membrane protease YdiL (CAAX protease family)